MDKQIESLFEGQEFSEDFKAKVIAVFESALEEKEQELTESIEQKYEKISESYAEYVRTELEETLDEYITEEVIPSVDKYVSFATKEFMNENKLAIESSTKVELAESFLKGVQGIAESYNVQIPEGKDDYITEMQTKLDKMQERFDKVLDEKSELEQSIVESKREKITAKLTTDLSESQKERFGKVAAKVKYQDDKQFNEAIEDLFESYHPKEADLNEQNKPKEEPETKQVVTESTNYLDSLFNKING